jgi:hypothetical protein
MKEKLIDAIINPDLFEITLSVLCGIIALCAVLMVLFG